MKNNTNKLIGSIIVFCLAVGAVFGYALYGAGQKSAQDQSASSGVQASAPDTTVGGTSAQMETTNPATSNQAPTAPSTVNTNRVSGRTSNDDSNEEGDDDSQSRSTPTPTPVKTVTTPASTVPADTRKQTVYKNGIYTAVGSYQSPAGTEQISVTVTLVNDVITNTSAVSMANDRTSNRYESKFIGGYASQIVGKNIDTVNLSYVSGSSLTPAGFNDALAQIKASARA
jgi:hypothetical protein